METPNLRLEKNRNSCERTAWVVVSVIFIGFYRKKNINKNVPCIAFDKSAYMALGTIHKLQL